MTYQEALDYLYSLINYDVARRDRYAVEGMTLQRPLHLLENLGNPHTAYPVIHLTGTKGKGSVGAMCAAILQAAGYRVGLYSSPHLQDFRERMRVNGEFIREEEVVALVRRIQPWIEPDLRWFEVVTALAFDYFREVQVDIAVVEVGLGGRLDATNVVHPLVSVITSLSLDHMSLLGNTLPEIAYEKAGIIKPDVPVVSAPQPPEALAVIEQTAAEKNASLILVGRDWQLETLGGDLQWEHWRAAPPGEVLQDYRTVLLGRHQAINGTVAIATIYELAKQGFSILPETIHEGLEGVNWVGRLEIIPRSPVVVLDAAHNGASAMCLKTTLLERFPHHRRVLVFAAKADKDIDGMLEALLPIADQVVITQAVDSRAESPENIAQRALHKGYARPLEIIPSVPPALAAAEAYAGTDGLVFVTGSMYLVGEARSLYGLAIGQSARTLYPIKM
jgi:dihydrofolate synthase/folylpolyglutamate synthase